MSLIKTLVSVTRLSHPVMLQFLRIGGAGRWVGGLMDILDLSLCGCLYHYKYGTPEFFEIDRTLPNLFLSYKRGRK